MVERPAPPAEIDIDCKFKSLSWDGFDHASPMLKSGGAGGPRPARLSLNLHRRGQQAVGQAHSLRREESALDAGTITSLANCSLAECKEMLRSLNPSLNAPAATAATAAAAVDTPAAARAAEEPDVAKVNPLHTRRRPLPKDMVEPLSHEFVDEEPVPSHADEHWSTGGAIVPHRTRSCDSDWWCGTMRAIHQIKELSVLELERQVGLQGSLSMSSFGSTSSLHAFSGTGGDLHHPKPFAQRSHSRSLDDLLPRGPDSDQYDAGHLSRDVGFSLEADEGVPHATHLDVGADARSTASPTDERPEAPPRDAAAGASNVAEGNAALSAADAYLFEAVFAMHPFAAAAFLRAFISCSFGLTFFHIHSLLAWPAELTPELQYWPRAKQWLILQIILLLVQMPMRVALQSSLHSVSVASDTQEAANRLRVIYLSSVWRWNKMLGYLSKAASLMGLWVLSNSGVLWHGLDEAQAAALTIEEAHLISICSSSLLVTMMRVCLTLSLLYFVQLAQPQQTSDAQKQGLSAGSIQHLRRIEYHPPEPCNDREDHATQCTVCLAEYEDGDTLIVLPCDPRHNFHASCIEPWLQRMATCPLCQRGVTTSGNPN